MTLQVILGMDIRYNITSGVVWSPKKKRNMNAEVYMYAWVYSTTFHKKKHKDIFLGHDRSFELVTKLLSGQNVKYLFEISSVH